jgi:hypothetical protein
LSLVNEFKISKNRVIRNGENVNSINADRIVEWHEKLKELRKESILFLRDALNDKS